MKALVFIPEEYNGLELFGLVRTLRDEGISSSVIARRKTCEDEVTHDWINVHYTIYELMDKFTIPELMKEYDAFIVSSGAFNYTLKSWTDKDVRTLVKAFFKEGKTIGAICVGVPSIQDVVKGKKIACWPLVQEKELLRRAGAILTGRSVVRDGNVCTAEHQMATHNWGLAIASSIKGEEWKDPMVEKIFLVDEVSFEEGVDGKKV